MQRSRGGSSPGGPVPARGTSGCSAAWRVSAQGESLSAGWMQPEQEGHQDSPDGHLSFTPPVTTPFHR